MSAVLIRVGRATLALCADVGAMALALRASFSLLLVGRVDGRELARHLRRFAVAPLPLVLGASAVMGGVVAMQGLGYIRRYNASEVFGWAAGMSSFRDVGPLLLGFMLASRLGAKNTAELASMVARERLDALSALGLDVGRVVYAPRFFAVAIAGVLLYPLAATTVLLSSFLLAWIVGDQRFAVSWHSMLEYMDAGIVLEGLARMVAFSALIGLSSCHFGARAGPDARAIGRAVFASSVASMGGIVVVNLYLSFVGGAR